MLNYQETKGFKKIYVRTFFYIKKSSYVFVASIIWDVSIPMIRYFSWLKGVWAVLFRYRDGVLLCFGPCYDYAHGTVGYEHGTTRLMVV